MTDDEIMNLLGNVESNLSQAWATMFHLRQNLFQTGVDEETADAIKEIENQIYDLTIEFENAFAK